MVKTPFWRLKHNFWYLEPPLERTFSEPFESHCGCNHFGSSSGSPCGGRAKSDGGYVCSIQPSSNHGCRRPTWKPEANYLAGGKSTPLKNMSSSIGIVPNIWKNKKSLKAANCFSWVLMVVDGYQWMLAMNPNLGVHELGYDMTLGHGWLLGWWMGFSIISIQSLFQPCARIAWATPRARGVSAWLALLALKSINRGWIMVQNWW